MSIWLWIVVLLLVAVVGGALQTFQLAARGRIGRRSSLRSRRAAEYRLRQDEAASPTGEEERRSEP